MLGKNVWKATVVLPEECKDTSTFMLWWSTPQPLRPASEIGRRRPDRHNDGLDPLMKHENLPLKDSGVSRGKVVWSEGMYLRPQHFQQLKRYVESYVQQRCLGLQGAFWGFLGVEIDHDALALGKVSLTMAHGVFPDGTPFRLTQSGELPAPLDVPAHARDEIVLLALPLRRPGGEDTIFEEQADSPARYGVCSRGKSPTAMPSRSDPPPVRLPGRVFVWGVLASQLGSEWQGAWSAAHRRAAQRQPPGARPPAISRRCSVAGPAPHALQLPCANWTDCSNSAAKRSHSGSRSRAAAVCPRWRIFCCWR